MRVLVIPGFSKKAGSANRACIDEVICALQKIPGVDISITGENLKNVNVDVNWKKNPFFAFRKIIHWPVIDPYGLDECYKQIMKELKHNDYDAILACHMPYDCVLAAVHAKRKHPDTILMLYELDPITYEIDKARNSLGRYLYFLRERAERRTYDACDVLLHMECNRAKYQQSKYTKHNEKSVYLDFPLIHDLNIKEVPTKRIDNNKVRLIYTGKLMLHFRSPEYLIKLIVELRKIINVEIVFYSNGNCENLLHTYASKYDYIIQKGFVDRETLQEEIGASDFLVNIGNKISDMLPSKLLTYIETGKPIIHIKNQEKDACTSYLDRYGSAMIISEADHIEQNADRLALFLNEHYGQLLGSKTIMKLFKHNTAAYSARVITNNIRTRIHKQGTINGDK